VRSQQDSRRERQRARRRICDATSFACVLCSFEPFPRPNSSVSISGSPLCDYRSTRGDWLASGSDDTSVLLWKKGAAGAGAGAGERGGGARAAFRGGASDSSFGGGGGGRGVCVCFFFGGGREGGFRGIDVFLTWGTLCSMLTFSPSTWLNRCFSFVLLSGWFVCFGSVGVTVKHLGDGAGALEFEAIEA